MSVYQAVDGMVLAATLFFLDDDDEPLIPAPGFPKVKLFDSEDEVLSSSLGSASSEPGKWVSNISIPALNLTEKVELRLRWVMKDINGDKYTNNDSVIVSPKVDIRNSDIVIQHGDTDLAFTLPVAFSTGYTGNYKVYQANELLFSRDLTASDVEKNVSIDTTSFTVPIAAEDIPIPSLASYLLVVDVKPPASKKRSYTYKLWAVTPQILLGVSHLEDFLNKSHIENVIPELRYTDADLVMYLERGLYMFNRVKYPTGFTGTNMQGALFDAWLICSSYYALGAQLLAEGSLAFDFSGQGISLNVDRTPSLESALGRIENQITSEVEPLKKILNSQGITVGDGSIGKTNLNNPYASGRLGLINAATTRLPGNGNAFLGRRGSVFR